MLALPRPTLLLLTCWTAIAVVAQTADPPSFEAVSIRPSRPPGPDNNRFGVETSRGRVTIMNNTLRETIRWAHQLKSYQVVGTSPALGGRYDVSAVAGPETRDEKLRAMLQKALAERFKLTVHRETRELPVYSLVAAGKIKLRPAKDGAPAGGNFTRGRLSANLVLADLADYLSRQLDRPVIDNTQTTGVFEILLTWTPDLGPVSYDNPPDPNAPSIFTALQEQLGLRLDSRRLPVEVLVVDHAEPPSEN
jgi:uncharacterized protein (TIGR03435 family)